MRKSTLSLILRILIFFALVCAILNIVFFIIKNKNICLFISMVSLFIVGVAVLILVFGEDDKENISNKYVMLDKEEFENMKNTIYKQEKDIKRFKTIIKNKL